jgi:hypothetical protein
MDTVMHADVSTLYHIWEGVMLQEDHRAIISWEQARFVAWLPGALERAPKGKLYPKSSAQAFEFPWEKPQLTQKDAERLKGYGKSR